MPDADGRYHLIPNAILPPGTDLITGSAQGPFVDTGLEIDLDPFVSYDTEDPRGRDQVQRFKRVYLHPDTIRELAQVAGVLDQAPEGAVIREAEAYNRGYADAIKERVGEQLVELASRLGDLLPVLARADADGLGADEKPAEDAGDGFSQSDGLGRPSRVVGSSY